MNKKACFIAAVASIYFVFIVLYSKLEFEEGACEDPDLIWTCVSFCSKDEQKVSDVVIRQHFPFNETFLADVYDNYTIIRGKPSCLFTKNASTVKRIVDYEYEMSIDSYYFNSHRYCHEMVEKDGEYKWEMIVCDNSSLVHLIFHAFGMLLPLFYLKLKLIFL